MEDIYALLGISESTFQDFRLTANRLVDHQTELTISRNIRTLQEYEVRVLSDKGVTVPQQTIDEIIQKVIENAKNRQPDDSIFSVRELRIISYYLILLQSDTDAYDYALSLLDRNWRSLYFNGLSFYCLETWNLIDPPLRIKTCNLLTTKLKQYSDDNKKYVTLRNHMNLFEEAGPKRLALLLTTKGQDIKDATSYFYNRPSTLCQSYYSDVIINYLESMNVMDLDYIQSILNLNQSDRTKKLVMAGLVERVNEQGDDFHRSQLCKFANRTLGDITLLSTWAPFSGATEADASKLQRARQLVNLWFNQKIIETFFEVCVQDRDRKLFWLKYVDKLSGFRIVGSTFTKRLLQSDQRVSGIFLPYFIETDSYASQTSALVLFIKNKMLVEFSDTGALYAYNHSHEMVKLVTKYKHRISSTTDLKIPSMGNLVDEDYWSYSCSDEGRLTHRGHWQDRLKRWLNMKVLSPEIKAISFFGVNEDSIFKAKPVEKIEFKPGTKPPVTTGRTLDDEASINKLSPIPKPPEKQPSAEPPTTVSTVKYETAVRADISSKPFFDDRFKIVVNTKGYFVNIIRSQRFVFLKGVPAGYRMIGSIWIKKTDTNGWSPVTHFYMGSEKPVGFIKKTENSLIFRTDMSSTDMIKITI